MVGSKIVSTRAKLLLAAAAAAALVGGFASSARAQVVINEVSYDDAGTDDLEYIEIYNSGASAVDISGWILRNSDTVAPPGDNNLDMTIPGAVNSGTTTLAPGAFYVIGNPSVANVNLTFAPGSTGALENDNEAIQLVDGANAVRDTLAYETNKGPVAVPMEGPGWFGNTGTTPDLTGRPTMSLGRFVDGKDTNNNGRDFGMRPGSPGTSNNTGLMTRYSPPDLTSLAVGATISGVTGTFVTPRVINPTALGTDNLNVIPDSPIPGKAITVFDPSGGGNVMTTNQVFGTAQSGFKFRAFFDTSDQPQNTSNATPPANILGQELSIYGIGGGDMLANFTDLSGAMGIGSATLPAAETANGTTGIAWVYERTAINGATAATQKLYLVDANDGGDSDLGGNTPLDWTILKTIDLSNLPSGWFDLGIEIDAAGNGVATFNGETFTFVAGALHSGALNIQYRENLNLATDGTPDAMIRPPTFVGVTSLYWDIDGVTAGSGGAAPSGTWDGAATNFNSDATGGGAGAITGATNAANDVVFGAGSDGTGAYTVNVVGTQSASSVTVARGDVTLSGGAIVSGSYNVASGATATVSSNVLGDFATASVVKQGAGTLTISSANTYTGGTIVAAGKLVLAHADATAGGAIDVRNGAVAQAQAGLTKAVTVTTLNTNASGKFDLTNNSMVVKGMTDAQVRTQLQAGYNAGAWNGPTGIVSTSITPETSIGYATKAQTGITDFKGVTGMADTDVQVKFTYAGDANLDGKVDIGDLGLLAGAWQAASGKVWFDGDFTYDGAVDIGDLGLLSGNWQKGTAGNPNPPLMDFAQAMAQFSAFDGVVVPEPTSLGLLGIAGAGLLARRRRPC